MMKNIIASIDFSEDTDKIIAAALAQATAFDGTLWLLHVTEPDPDFRGYQAGPSIVRESISDTFPEQAGKLQELAKQARDKGAKVEPVLIQGPTVLAIVEEAEKLNADLMVMGSHGHGVIFRSLLGSVSEGVLRKAPCPLMIVPTRRK